MKSNSFKLKPSDLRGGIDDVFYNTFDRTWAKVAPDAEPYPRVMTKIPIEVADDDGTVTYTYNSEYFRCDEFSTSHVGGNHVLFAGCSQTEGVGAPIETVWSKALSDKINSDGFYSIAKSGFGWQKLITNFMLYVDKYGAPDYMYALLPNVGRFFEWNDSDNSYMYVQRYPNNNLESTEQADPSKVPSMTLLEKPLTLAEHRKCFVDFTISWKLFEKYCESIGTKLLWGSWDYDENKNYRLANISKNYVDLSHEGLLSFIQSARPDGVLGKFDLSRRDGHAGILVNEYWQDVFLNEARKRGWANV